MKITKAEIKQILLEEVGGYIFDKEGKITPANLQQALDALFQRLKDEDKAEDSKNEATEDELKNKREEIELLQREKELKQDIKNLQTEVYTEADAWNNAYIEGLNQGMSEDEAADYADKKAEEYLTMNELKKVQRKIKEGSISVEEVREVVRKVGGKYALYTKKKDPKTGERRRLGTHDTKSQAEEQERAIYANKK
jgi:hypothetical protein